MSACSYRFPALVLDVLAIVGHEVPQFYLHFGSNFSPHAHVQHKPRVTRSQAPEFGRWQALFAKKPLNKAGDVHDVSSMIDPD
ncbi:MAG: hypothetical protein JHC92_10125 [Sphingomonadaceae bacterium]|nr:hypothetical protein [Sphingomonadaceae bacterium]